MMSTGSRGVDLGGIPKSYTLSVGSQWSKTCSDTHESRAVEKPGKELGIA